MEPRGAPPVLVVGTVALDSVETPFGRVDEAIGGSATYFAGAASLYAPVRIVAVVGDDFPLRSLDFLKARGVDLGGLEVRRGGRTFRWAGRYHHDLNHRDTLRTDLNVLATFQPKLPEEWTATRYVFLANIDPDLQVAVLDQVRDPALVFCDTMNFWIEGKPEALRRVLARVDGVVLNDAEARELAGEPNLVKAASVIRRMGPRIVVVKKGEHGALLFDEHGVFAAPAYPLEFVFDPTGAGDSFAGGLFGHLASEHARNGGTLPPMALRRAVVHGSAVASFSVEKFGPERLVSLTAREVDERFRAFRALSDFA